MQWNSNTTFRLKPRAASGRVENRRVELREASFGFLNGLSAAEAFAQLSGIPILERHSRVAEVKSRLCLCSSSFCFPRYCQADARRRPCLFRKPKCKKAPLAALMIRAAAPPRFVLPTRRFRPAKKPRWTWSSRGTVALMTVSTCATRGRHPLLQSVAGNQRLDRFPLFAWSQAAGICFAVCLLLQSRRRKTCVGGAAV